MRAYDHCGGTLLIKATLNRFYDDGTEEYLLPHDRAFSAHHHSSIPLALWLARLVFSVEIDEPSVSETEQFAQLARQVHEYVSPRVE